MQSVVRCFWNLIGVGWWNGKEWSDWNFESSTGMVRVRRVEWWCWLSCSVLVASRKWMVVNRVMAWGRFITMI